MTINTCFLIQQTNMKKFGLELKQKSKELMVERIFYQKDYSRIKLDTNDDLRLNKTLKIFNIGNNF